MDLEFLKFEAQQFSKVWGGDKLHKLFAKPVGERLGESWEISGVPSKVSAIEQEGLEQKSLTELIEKFGAQLLGRRVFDIYQGEFPLLFKFIDAKEDLSVQLHPDDAIAKKYHNSFGKTEMWYVMQADPGARLVIGFKPEVTLAEYQTALKQGKITDILNEVPVQPGDAFFIAPGLVHAIGGGVVLAEIQQTSDVTYRIYDWDRPDVNGALRELHIEQAERALVFHDLSQVFCRPKEIADNRANLVYASEYFKTSLWQLTQTVSMATDPEESFMVLMCVTGQAKLSSANGHSVSLNCGETVLIPAAMGTFDVQTSGAEILEVIVP
ncbi:MAG TPA: mannose-6-phosphate isomerase [Flavobacteriaceae bacterium]|nr:mannose-6-phosphate isomerase [Flavobacteriaceae bacterium]